MKDLQAEWKVFASYADHDAKIIRPIVDVLRAAFQESQGVVFWARDSIPAGEDWRKHLASAIAMSKRVFVFWCKHSRGSKWVQWEYEKALKLKRTTIPVLLDDEALPIRLAAFQAVDLRVLGTHLSPAPEEIRLVVGRGGQGCSFGAARTPLRVCFMGADDTAAPKHGGKPRGERVRHEVR